MVTGGQKVNCKSLGASRCIIKSLLQTQNAEDVPVESNIYLLTGNSLGHYVMQGHLIQPQENESEHLL